MLGRNPLRVRLAGAHLPVEGADVSDAGAELPGGDSDLRCDRFDRGSHRLVAMEVLVGVEMGRVPADEVTERGQLGGDGVPHRHRVVRVDDDVRGLPPAVAVLPLAEIDVEAEREVGSLARIAGGLGSRRPANHQARARDHAVLVRTDDPPIDTAAAAEIVRVHDELTVAHSASRSAVRAASPSQSCSWAGGGAQDADHPSHCTASSRRAHSSASANAAVGAASGQLVVIGGRQLLPWLERPTPAVSAARSLTPGPTAAISQSTGRTRPLSSTRTFDA